MECYLDNSATTKPCKAAVDAEISALTELYGNPSSLHQKGVDAYMLLEKSRANGLTQAVSLPESIDAPVEEGEPLGALDIFDADGTPVASLPLLAGESIPHLTWSELFCRLLKLAYCGA